MTTIMSALYCGGTLTLSEEDGPAEQVQLSTLRAALRIAETFAITRTADLVALESFLSGNVYTLFTTDQEGHLRVYGHRKKS